jgi:FlaA1/EpsC-like NDP-sugar epimerase
MRRIQQFVSNTKWLKIALDAVAVLVSFFVALSIHYEFAIPSKNLTNFLAAVPVVVLLFIVTNYLMGMYAGRWKNASFDELVSLCSSVVISTAILFVAVLLIPGARKAVPVSVAVIGGLFSLFVLAFIRLEFRFFAERKLRLGMAGSRKVLLIGAGEAGEIVLVDMLRHPEYDYSPVGFIDDDPQ